jgi:hypothetical protein
MIFLFLPKIYILYCGIFSRYTLTTVVLDSFIEDSTIKNDVHTCFECGKQVPEHLAACWNCGEILDPNLRRLMKKE